MKLCRSLVLPSISFLTSFDSPLPAVSILAVSYTVTMISVDFDLNPDARFQAPTFYGYIPSDSKSRLIVTITMCLFSACHIAMQILKVALLALIGSVYVCTFLGADMLFFLLFKTARGDLR